uniref:hypothetical protein n=1 Tax=Spirosoma sp. 209 TaxID=1955701 RepID=UPI00098D61DA
MRLLYIWLLALLSGFALLPTTSQATHVRAGEITTRRISQTSLTYEITFTAYYDEIRGRDAAREGDEYTICFGDGTSQLVRRQPPVFINGRTSSINVYRVVHTYPAANPYTISVTVPNRNNETKNLPAPSEAIFFYVSSTILISNNLGQNSTPIMLNPPLDSARVGQRFCHNPAAFDVDGDSLAYRLSVPKEGLEIVCPRFRDIPGYQSPTRFSRTSETGGTPTFQIDSRTGELCWDAPGEEGQFNFAFIVEEWRNGVLIGETTRDMQIIVVDNPNRRPRINPLPDLCVEAGTLINQPITATDPDGQRVIITAFGGVFNVGQDGQPLPAGELIAPQYAQLANGNTPINQPGTATFRWQTNCNQIREAPYDVTFKVNDVPPRGTTSLVSFQTLRIQVVGPSVKNLTARPTATATGRAIQLSWDPYTCGRAGTTIAIYRKEGCTDIPLDPCQTGLAASTGYQEIARVPLTATSYVDTSALRRGVSYSYRLVAQYPDGSSTITDGVIDQASLNGGQSIASNQACLELPLLAPVMTQVTVDSTRDTNGQITVRWSRPIGLNPGDLPGPYQYRLQRATGLDAQDFATIATINTSLLPNPDTVFVDRGTPSAPLNTQANPYRYRVEFFYTSTAGQLTRLDVTEAASSVRLTTRPANRQVSL